MADSVNRRGLLTNRSEGRDSAQEKKKQKKKKRKGVIIILRVQKNTKEIGKNRKEPHRKIILKIYKDPWLGQDLHAFETSGKVCTGAW